MQGKHEALWNVMNAKQLSKKCYYRGMESGLYISTICTTRETAAIGWITLCAAFTLVLILVSPSMPNTFVGIPNMQWRWYVRNAFANHMKWNSRRGWMAYTFYNIFCESFWCKELISGYDWIVMYFSSILHEHQHFKTDWIIYKSIE